MAKRIWTLLGMSADPSGDRQFKPSRELVRLGFAAVLLVVAFLGSAATQLFHQAETSIENRLKLRRATQMGVQLDGLRARIDTLAESLRSVARGDQTLRLTGAERNPVADIAAPVPAAAVVTTADVTAEVDALLRRARVLAFGWREASDELKKRYDTVATTPSILPTSGYIASVFSRSRFHPILGRERPHLGIDIVAPKGTPVVAAARGRVSFVGRRGEYGLLVEIDHGHNRATRYAHLSAITVRVGQRIERSDVIGRVGATGLAVGAHLHYEVLINGRPANPRRYIVEHQTTAN